MPASFNIQVYNNQVFTFTATWESAPSTPVNITNYSALMQVRPYVGADVVLFSLGTPPLNSGISLGGTNGVVTIEIAPQEYTGIQPGNYVYDLILIDSNNNSTPILSGSFDILQGVSQPNSNSVVLTTSTAPSSVTSLTVVTSLVSEGTATFTNITVNGGTIDNTVIGGTTPDAATFTNLTNTGTATLKNITSATATFTGGSIDNMIVGGTTPSEGKFTTLNSTQAASLAQVLSPSVTLTGGTIDNVVIGGTTPVNGTFSNLKVTTSFTLPPGISTSTPFFQTSDVFSDFVVTGLTATVPSASLSLTISGGTAYVLGQRVTVATGAATLTNTYAASTTTYVDLSNVGVITYTTSSTVTANSLRILSVVTNATQITAINQIAGSAPTATIAEAVSSFEAITLGQAQALFNPLLGFTPIQNVFTTIGDMVYEGSSGTTRLPIGIANQVLSVSGGIPTWVTLSGSSTLTSADVTNALGYVPATSGANSDITSITGLTTPLAVSEGGTGVSTITGVIAGNGTGAFSAATEAEIIAALTYTPAHSGANSDITSLTGLTSPLPVPNATASGDAINLGQADGRYAPIFNVVSSFTGALTVVNAYVQANGNITLPATAGLKAGDWLYFYTQGTTSIITVNNTASDFIYSPTLGITNTTTTSITLNAGDSLYLINRGGAEWDVVGGSILISQQSYLPIVSALISGSFNGKTTFGTGLSVGNDFAGNSEADYILNPGAAAGGHNFYQTNSSGASPSLLMQILSSGSTLNSNLSVTGNLSASGNLTVSGTASIAGTLSVANATTAGNAVALGQLSNASINPLFLNGVNLQSSGGLVQIYTDPSGTGTANDLVFRTGASGSYKYTIINGTNGQISMPTSAVIYSGLYVGPDVTNANQIYLTLNSTSAIFRNDGASFYILGSATSATGQFNNARPFSFNLSSGAVTIDGSNNGTTFGGTISVNGDVHLGSQWIRPEANTGTGMQLTTGGRLYIPNGDSYSIGGYGYVAYENAGVITGGTSGTFGLAVANRIQCSELDATSDIRLKQDIKEISPEDGLEFILSVKPKIWNWKNDGHKGSGYIAQDVIKTKYHHMISAIENNELEELIDEDGFISPKGSQLTINYDSSIAYLHSALRWAVNEIEQLKSKLSSIEVSQ